MRMRTWLAVLGLVLLGASLGQAAPELMSSQPLVLTSEMRHVLSTGLSQAAQRDLAGDLTRDEQLRLLKLDPASSARLAGLTLPQTKALSSSPWDTGIVLRPLSTEYPVGSGFNFVACLRSIAIEMGPGALLPRATQKPPLVWFWQTSNSAPLFWLDIHWPAPGSYVITFFMKDLLPSSIAKPRVQLGGKPPINLVPNVPSGAGRWTVLWDASDPNNLNQRLDILPSESGWGFLFSCLSKVVIRRLK